MSILRCFLLFLLFSVEALAQQKSDTLLVSTERAPKTEHKNKKERKKLLRWKLGETLPNPGTAFLYSAILPGLGQAYNRRYWKVPIVVGGLIGGILIINTHQTNYYNFKKELYGILRDSNYTPPSNLTEPQLRSRIDDSRRNRDLFTMLTILWYMLQAVEAHVDAHLSFFAINPNLEVSIEPIINTGFIGGNQVGLALKIRF